jgi:GxxExxY protein
MVDLADRDPLTEKIIGFAIEVHRQIGPGLLESAYEECLCFELRNSGIAFRRQVPLPIGYKSVRLDCGYRLDVLVKEKVILELKAVERLLSVHDAQMLTYLKMSGIKTGLIVNFAGATLKEGLRRFVM